MEFLQLSETTRAREIDVELKKNKWRNEKLDPTRAWVAPGPLLDIFLFFSKTKIFHSHPCVYMGVWERFLVCIYRLVCDCEHMWTCVCLYRCVCRDVCKYV